MRLDLALIARHPGLSRRKARDVIEKGQVLLHGAMVQDPGRAVAEDADIRWDPNRKALSRARSTVPILFQDETLLVVNKPAGLLAVPTSPEAAETEDTVLARVQEYVHHLRPQNPYVGIVHRLDRDTTGSLLFALTPSDRNALRTLFREHRLQRRYNALVNGTPRADQGEINLPIRDSYQSGRREVARDEEESKPALTRFKVLERFPGAALLEVELETGRQHQIRLHLAHVGLPVIGDAVYGRRRPTRDRPAPRPTPAAESLPKVSAPRQMLHARTLAFTHPVTGRAINVDAPLPEDFKTLLVRLRRGQAPRKE